MNLNTESQQRGFLNGEGEKGDFLTGQIADGILSLLVTSQHYLLNVGVRRKHGGLGGNLGVWISRLQGPYLQRDETNKLQSVPVKKKKTRIVLLAFPGEPRGTLQFEFSGGPQNQLSSQPRSKLTHLVISHTVKYLLKKEVHAFTNGSQQVIL